MMQKLVIKFNTVKSETQTFFNWNDLADPIIKTMGYEMWDAIQVLKDEDCKNVSESGPSMITYIEDGVFSEQIEESGVIKELVSMVLADLDSQGFIKKNKSLDKFSYEDIYYKEKIDEKLSPGMMKYFEKLEE